MVFWRSKKHIRPLQAVQRETDDRNCQFGTDQHETGRRRCGGDPSKWRHQRNPGEKRRRCGNWQSLRRILCAGQRAPKIYEVSQVTSTN